MLQNIIKIGLCISLSYVMGLAAHIWWEVKIFLVFVLGAVFVGLFFQSVVSENQLSAGTAIQSVLPYIMVFTPLGYLTGHPIVKYFGDQLEAFLGSDEFDATYRQHAKHHKTAFANDDKNAFQDFFRAHQAETRSNSGAYYEQTKARSSTPYEDYNQYRKSQTKQERTSPPPQQDYRSDKDKMFDILGVADRNASTKVLKSAYRKQAWKYHPDVLARNNLSEVQLKKAEARMQDINHAYDWVKDNGFAD